ncbi:zinc finger protein 664 [Octopus bimaculoides]|uniref:zinc finger protein 664 n=1 Tax=Octopus bimaculoides TaxID=37653 RepID=UPI0022E21390|nr:zinc finger protein 664 [Octopus bimaculoides]
MSLIVTFCITNIGGFSKKTKAKIVYADCKSALKPVPHDIENPVPVSLSHDSLEDLDTHHPDSPIDEEYVVDSKKNEPRLFNEEDLVKLKDYTRRHFSVLMCFLKMNMENVNHLDTANTAGFNDTVTVTQIDRDERPLHIETVIKQRSLERNSSDYRCEIRRKTFSSEHEVFRHKVIHYREKLFQCEVCGKSFVFNSKLASHKRMHTGEKPYECAICGKSFFYNSHLVTHKRTHTGEKPFHCEMCGNHTGEKPFRCELCGKSFIKKSCLVVHKRGHNGEKPYQCEICGKSFVKNSSHVDHKIIHTGERPYHCEICGKSFTHNSHLVVHVRTHTGEKPYHCDICGKSLSDGTDVEFFTSSTSSICIIYYK